MAHHQTLDITEAVCLKLLSSQEEGKEPQLLRVHLLHGHVITVLSSNTPATVASHGTCWKRSIILIPQVSGQGKKAFWFPCSIYTYCYIKEILNLYETWNNLTKCNFFTFGIRNFFVKMCFFFIFVICVDFYLDMCNCFMVKCDKIIIYYIIVRHTCDLYQPCIPFHSFHGNEIQELPDSFIIRFFTVPLPMMARNNATRFRFWQPNSAGKFSLKS